MLNKNKRPWYRNPFIIVPIIGVIVAIIAGIVIPIIITQYEINPDFSISINPMEGNVQQGGVISTAIIIKGIHGYEYSVSLSASDQPSGVIVTFIPPFGGPTPSYTSTVTINVDPDVSPDSYKITINGLGADGKEHSCKYILTVIPATGKSQEIPTISVEYEGGIQFAGKITCHGLKPESEYILTLNGKVEQAGNEELKKFGEWDNEGVYDFMRIRTDSGGDVSADFSAEDLPPGNYDVTFLVKEAWGNWEPLYTEDHVQFTITSKKVINVPDVFYPSGWMGDWGDISLDDAFTGNPHSGPACIKITYSGAESQGKGWAEIYWQYPDSNWGDNTESRDLTGATKLTFWVRGENSGAKAEFKVGGITGNYPDSIQPPVSTGVIVLSEKWQQYTIDLAGKDLSHVIGGFCWVTSKDLNPFGCTIYLDDIRFE